MTLFHSHTLERDLKAVVQSLEALLESSAENAGDAMTDVRKSIEARLQQARTTLATLEKHAARQARIAARNADRYVHDNPWQTLGIAAGIGVLIGLLLGRRDR